MNKSKDFLMKGDKIRFLKKDYRVSGITSPITFEVDDGDVTIMITPGARIEWNQKKKRWEVSGASLIDTSALNTVRGEQGGSLAGLKEHLEAVGVKMIGVDSSEMTGEQIRKKIEESLEGLRDGEVPGSKFDDNSVVSPDDAMSAANSSMNEHQWKEMLNKPYDENEPSHLTILRAITSVLQNSCEVPPQVQIEMDIPVGPCTIKEHSHREYTGDIDMSIRILYIDKRRQDAFLAFQENCSGI